MIFGGDKEKRDEEKRQRIIAEQKAREQSLSSIDSPDIDTDGTPGRDEALSPELLKKMLYASPKDLIYDADMIKEYRIDEAIQNHPLSQKHYTLRSKLAYKELLTTLSPTPKYLLPGQICIFEYLQPKYKNELEYYDRTPFVLFFGIVRLPSGVIREIGVNLHYFPPYARAAALNTIYEVFKDYYSKYFNDAPRKPNMYVTWPAVKALMKNSKVGFAVKMYIPVLRSKTYVLPSKMIATASYTEGHFSKATARLIYQFWRHYKRK